MNSNSSKQQHTFKKKKKSIIQTSNIQAFKRYIQSVFLLNYEIWTMNKSVKERIDNLREN